MRNVEVRLARVTELSLPPGARIAHGGVRLCAAPTGGMRVYALVTGGADGAPALLCAHVNEGDGVGTSPPSPWPACNLARFLGAPDDVPAALDADAAGLDAPVVALRGGALVSVDAETGAAELVGEVEDEKGVEERGGVLAMAKSPDGALVALVSPVKIMVLTSAWEPVAEVEVVDEKGDLRVAVEAQISWRGDGAYFAVCMRDAAGVAYARIVDREGDGVVRAELEEVLAEAAGTTSKKVQGEDVGSTDNADGGAASVALGTAVAWQPRVGGIVCVAGPGHAISAFERNGLRHLRNDFSLQADADVEGGAACAGVPFLLEWSCDSGMLAVACRGHRARENQVDIYVRSNYRWYRKQCLRLRCREEVADVRWDADDRSLLHVASRSGVLTSFALRSSHVGAVSRDGLACVVDGHKLLVTDLAKALVPPPMCQRTLHAPDAIIAVVHDDREQSGSAARRVVTVLLASGNFARLPMEDGEAVKSRSTGIDDVISAGAATWIVSCEKRTGGALAGLRRFPVCVAKDVIASVEDDETGCGDIVALFFLGPDSAKAQMVASCPTQGRARALSLAPDSCLSEAVEECILVSALSTGALLRLSVRGAQSAPDGCSIHVLDSVECNAASRALSVHEVAVSCVESVRRVVFVHDESGCLEAIDLSSKVSVQLSAECTSFCVSRGHLLFTTRSHVLHCVPILSSSKLVSDKGNPKKAHSSRASETTGAASIMSRFGLEAQRVDAASSSTQPPSTTAGTVRPIDRASVIVCALPDDVRIVLQAPRGNIETVAPRPLVHAEVWRLASAKEYGAAFRLSRQQRVDMNIMVDADPEEFLRQIPLLIEQVPVASHLSVFLTYLRGGKDRINAICDGVVSAIDALEDQKLASRLNSAVLTALVVRQPPLFGGGLRRVQESYRRSEEEGASALDFLLVLSKNEEMLYNEALGAYDLKLALMVAKASQLDPVEYSNELRVLRSLSEERRRFTIDLKLERYSAALSNLFDCGPSERSACLELAREHHLYGQALKLFASDAAACFQLRSWYADRLLSQESYADAATVLVANGDMQSAARAYRDGGYWRMALSSFPPDGGDDSTTEMPMGTADIEGPRPSVESWSAFAETVADLLSERGQYVDAATVRWDMLHDLDGALDELVEAQEWLSAFETLASAQSWQAERRFSEVGKPSAASKPENRLSENLMGCNGRGDLPSVTSCRARIMCELDIAAKDHIKDLNDNAVKLRERSERLAAVRETKERMLKTLGVPGTGGNGEDGDSDVISASTGVSSVGSFGSDMTFASSTATARTQTSLYHSIGRGSGGVGGVKQLQAERRRATKAARKRIRTGHPREEEALIATLKRLVPNPFLRARVGVTITALSHSGNQALAASLQLAMCTVYARCHSLPDDLLSLDAVQETLADESWRIPVLGVLHNSPAAVRATS